MLKFSARKKDKTNLVGLVLEPGNLVRLKEGKPIFVPGASVDVPSCNFVFMYGSDRDGVVSAVGPFLERYYGHEGKVNALHVGEKFYVFILPMGSSTVYLLGLDDTSFKALEAGERFNFRTRVVEGTTVGSTLEVLVLLGDAEQVEAEMRESGLISEKTRYTREV